MQPKTRQIIEQFPTGTLVISKAQFKKLLKDHKTNYYCYMLVADNAAGHIIGEGTGNRAAFLFGGCAAPGHIKAFTRAMLEFTSDTIEIIIFPVQPDVSGKKPSLIKALEKTLQDFCPEFSSMPYEQKNEILLEKRLNQLTEEIQIDVKYFLFPLIYAAGSEMSTYKKYLKKYPDEIQKSIHQIMGGFYKDI
tara:strand:+ start:70 stop:645 length:576 start_codon:yes stop_codon:yes gene_type:complete